MRKMRKKRKTINRGIFISKVTKNDNDNDNDNETKRERENKGETLENYIVEKITEKLLDISPSTEEIQ